MSDIQCWQDDASVVDNESTSCILVDEALEVEVEGETNCLENQSSRVQFVCIGDWGQRTPSLLGVAKSMASTIHDFQFVVPLGDNFYFSGVKNITDWHWKSVFEEPFKDVTCPWYPILGNHDWEGDPSAQMAYSRVNAKWQMPALYYSKTFGNGLADIFFIDTTSLCPLESFSLTCRRFPEKDRDAQYAWLERKLAESTCKWKIVCGHYPVYSNGENGSTKELQTLEELMSRFGVDAYICGHDHSMQHLHNQETGIHYFVAGSGSSTRFFYQRQTLPPTLWKSLTCGYFHCGITDVEAKFSFLDVTGASVYDYSISKSSTMCETASAELLSGVTPMSTPMSVSAPFFSPPSPQASTYDDDV
jgi:tartrate-resistant acid phosphatase type 5